MTHLTDEQIADAVDGQAPACDAHLDACGECARKVHELRDTLRTVSGIDAPEPSPLFWASFTSRVNGAIDAPPPQRAWWAASWLAGAGVAAAIVVAAAVTVVQRSQEVAVPPIAVSGQAASDTAAAADGVADLLDAHPWSEDDAAWELVRTAATDLDYDDVREAGIAPRPGAVERAALELGEEERAELVRLLQDELTRRGV